MGDSFQCIAVSRAIGNLGYVPFGMTHRPSISIPYTVPHTQRHCIFIASDGVWDVWKFEDLATRIRTHVRRGLSVQQLCDALVCESSDLASAVFGPEHCDDISCVAWYV